jgi:KDO2-lipid IV(A) lauroyltransferase
VRSRFDAKLIRMKMSAREIIAHRHQLSISIIISDQTPVPGDVVCKTTFLNQPTAVFTGIEKLAKTCDYPVIFCDIKVVKRGHYTCEFVPLVEHPKSTAENEITELHVRHLEKMIKAEPQYWIWSHKRWKYQF